MRVLDPVPTSRREWERLSGTTTRVVTRPRYGPVAVLAGAAALTLFVASQNLNLFLTVVVFGESTVAARLAFLLDLYPFVGPLYGAVRGGLLVVTSALVGLNTALVAYRLVELGLLAREGWLGAGGVLFGALGAGCAACGSAALAGIFSTFGIAASVTVLPLNGVEFLLLAVAGLSVALATLTEAIDDDPACRRA